MRTYAILPTAADPKIVVPARPSRTAAVALGNYNTAAPRRQRRMLNALAALLRAGLGGIYPYRMHVETHAATDPDDIERLLSKICGTSVRVSLFVSPPRAVRKPVLQVLDERGEVVGYTKLGVDPFTRSLLGAEAAAVERLGRSELLSIGLPTILYHGEWRGTGVLLQTAIPRGAPAHSARPEVRRAAVELTRACRGATCALEASSYWHELVRRVRALDPGPAAGRIERSVGMLAAHAGDVLVEFGCSHGDWAPWNMTVTGGRVHVWDWEKFADNVPAGFDTIHFFVQEAVVSAGVDIVDAFARATAGTDRLLADFALRPANADLSVWLYAIELAVRYLEDAEGERGRTRMSRLGDWLDPVLTAQESRCPAPGATA